MTQPRGYTTVQIGLHWIVAVLIVLQYVFKDAISAAWRALRLGQETGFDPLVAQHVFGGILIMVLVVWRLVLRARHGAPPPPDQEAPALKLLAKATHGLLYLLMLGLPVSGAVAWFGGVGPAAGTHEVMKTLLLLLVLLHVVGALYHQFVLKTNLMARMKRSTA
ncbi:cytochrome b [Pontitalea aquivivens]|uniref:cytochrome b n=1 Tax=Pontitalea aquivivens TaxID=3388663 RepID=UPI003970992D